MVVIEICKTHWIVTENLGETQVYIAWYVSLAEPELSGMYGVICATEILAKAKRSRNNLLLNYTYYMDFTIVVSNNRIVTIILHLWISVPEN